ncbi:hypothetical protein QU38_00860, partial [Staphylococcus aureus]
TPGRHAQQRIVDVGAIVIVHDVQHPREIEHAPQRMAARDQLTGLRREIQGWPVPGIEFDLPIGRLARLHFQWRRRQQPGCDDVPGAAVDAPSGGADLCLAQIGDGLSRTCIEESWTTRGLRAPDGLIHEPLQADLG